MRPHLRTICLFSAVCGAAVLLAPTTPAVAQFPGGLIGGAIGGGIFGGGPRIGVPYYGQGGGQYSRRGRHRPKSDEARDDTPAPRESREESRRALASLAPPSQKEQNAILKSVTASGVLGMVGSTKDINDVGRTISRDLNDSNRDYTKKIKDDIVDRLVREQKRAADKNRGDVTEHAIERSLEKALKQAKLDLFESFIGENWSAERLRVLILNRVDAELDRLISGNTLGHVPMEEVDKLIQRSADSVYRRIFETSELLAANRSSALFLQRLYQTHGKLLDDQTREVTDRLITEGSNAAIARFDAPMRRDEHGFALRYRAQRIVFDCLSENVERISASETGMATVGEIERNTRETALNTCLAWLETQFGTERDRVRTQSPMPLRVIWTATGPKDDPSMYGRVGGTL